MRIQVGPRDILRVFCNFSTCVLLDELKYFTLLEKFKLGVFVPYLLYCVAIIK